MAQRALVTGARSMPGSRRRATAFSRSSATIPAFVMMSYGNEPGGKEQKSWLGTLVKRWKNLDQASAVRRRRRLADDSQNDFHVTPDARAFQ